MSSSPSKVAKPKAPINVGSFQTDYNSDDEEIKDKVPESVILQNQRRKQSKIGHILENELIRSDTIMRK